MLKINKLCSSFPFTCFNMYMYCWSNVLSCVIEDVFFGGGVFLVLCDEVIVMSLYDSLFTGGTGLAH